MVDIPEGISLGSLSDRVSTLYEQNIVWAARVAELEARIERLEAAGTEEDDRTRAALGGLHDLQKSFDEKKKLDEKKS